MKFLCINKKIKIDDSFKIIFDYKIDEKYFNYFYNSNNIKNRKCVKNVRPGVSSNPKKNSIKRDKNFNILNQFINLNCKKGKKNIFLKHFNIMFENFSDWLNIEYEDFKKYKYYDFLFYSSKLDPSYSDLNSLLKHCIFGLESIFEIKTSKNNKKLKMKTKYSHEIIYIPKERRVKYILKALSFYKEHFKKYELWERLFWSILMILINKDNSFLKKRREYIYIKSIKFFKKRKSQKKI